MLFLCVMGLVKNQKIYLFNFYVGVEQTLGQYLRCTDNHHVLFKVLIPSLFTPQVRTHGTKKVRDVLVYVVA